MEKELFADAVAEIGLTGSLVRMDLATLSDLSLLPGRSPEAPPLKPFYNPNRRRDPSVDLNGIIR